MKKTLIITLVLISLNMQAQWLTNGSKVYYNGGSVGIGTISPTFSLDVRGNLRLLTSGSTRASAHFYASGTAEAGIFFDASNGDGIGSDYGSLIQKDNLAIELTNYGNNPLKFRTSNTDRLTILGDGNVGIGMTTPESRLHLNQNSANGQIVNQLIIDGQSQSTLVDGSGQVISFKANIDRWWGAVGGYTANSKEGIGLFAGVSTTLNSVPGLYLNSDQKVGIGTTQPQEKLHLYDPTSAHATIETASANHAARVYFRGKRETTGTSIHHIGTTGVGNYDLEFQADENLRLATNSVVRMSVSGNGKVGIGTTTPNEKLEVIGNLRVQGISGQSHAQLQFFRATGHQFMTIGQADLNASNSTFDFHHHNGNDFRFLVNSAELLRIDNSGAVGIGTSTPGAKLEVAGNALIQGDVYAKLIEVSATPGNWPDYVFESNYGLRPLSEVEAYVNANKHLPEVPSAKTVEAEGQNLGEIQATLLKKVEELTLYLIEQDKKQLSLEERLKKLEVENAKLKKLLEQQ